MLDSTSAEGFVDRRGPVPDSAGSTIPVERRQFTNSHQELSPPAQELAIAIDEYKLVHRRRFITYEEIMSVILDLGYSKSREQG